ncbi:MAG: hypothetical protein H6710_24190 [Myxococcales bacterium]|nr:hypothetical protein [Myxococcales bacterium]
MERRPIDRLGSVLQPSHDLEPPNDPPAAARQPPRPRPRPQRPRRLRALARGLADARRGFPRRGDARGGRARLRRRGRGRARLRGGGDAESDGDGDGVADSVDACPTTPGIADDGCPPLDGDGDGIVDAEDKCVHEPETRNGYEDEDGCP